MPEGREIPARASMGKRSQLEEQVNDELRVAQYIAAYETVTIHFRGRDYRPDFLCVASFGPRLVVEVKPTRAVAAVEIRHDMLLPESPLWLLADLFVVAFDLDEWVCRGRLSDWHECTVNERGLTVRDEPCDWGQ